MWLKLVWQQLRWADLVLMALVLVAIGLSVRYFAVGKADRQVYVYKNDQLWGVYPIAQDTVAEIDEHNRIEIKEGKVRVSYADCPDKRCVKQGWTNNMPIICVPNRLIIEIKTSPDEHKLILH